MVLGAIELPFGFSFHHFLSSASKKRGSSVSSFKKLFLWNSVTKLRAKAYPAQATKHIQSVHISSGKRPPASALHSPVWWSHNVQIGEYAFPQSLFPSQLNLEAAIVRSPLCKHWRKKARKVKPSLPQEHPFWAGDQRCPSRRNRKTFSLVPDLPNRLPQWFQKLNQ